MIEHGSLRELTDELVRLVGNRRVPQGTTILVYSTTFLAEVGVVAYVEEFLVICMVLRERLGKSTVVLPLPPIILGGLEHPATVRSMYELMSWSDDYFKNEMAYLDASMKLARDIIEEQGRDRRVVEFRRMLLPDMQAKCGRKAWNSGGEGSSELPGELMPMTSEQERRWLSGIIDEIRSKLALDLDPVPTP